MADVLECEGAPRDLGLDQGRACRDTLQAEFHETSAIVRLRLWMGLGSGRARRIERDLRRYFPQQAEAFEGMSRGASVPRSWLIERLARDSSVADRTNGLSLAVGPELTSEGSLLACALPSGTVLRRSRPEGGFASAEATQPWRVAPLAGVNEAGLSVLATPGGSTRLDEPCAVSASLLALDCLARFDRLEGAIDWCLGRPCGGDAIVLLAEASGEIGGVRFRDGGRERFGPAEGLMAEAGGAEREEEIAKKLQQAALLAPTDLAQLLRVDLLVVEPARRRIGVLQSGSEPRWLSATRESAD